MAIDKEELIHVAKLANLNLEDKEVEKYTKDMQEILDFINLVNDIDTSNIKEAIGTNSEQYNVFRKDEVVKYENRDKLLNNAPSKDEGMFQIPKVINNN